MEGGLYYTIDNKKKSFYYQNQIFNYPINQNFLTKILKYNSTNQNILMSYLTLRNNNIKYVFNNKYIYIYKYKGIISFTSNISQIKKENPFKKYNLNDDYNNRHIHYLNNNFIPDNKKQKDIKIREIETKINIKQKFNIALPITYLINNYYSSEFSKYNISPISFAPNDYEYLTYKEIYFILPSYLFRIHNEDLNNDNFSNDLIYFNLIFNDTYNYNDKIISFFTQKENKFKLKYTLLNNIKEKNKEGTYNDKYINILNDKKDIKINLTSIEEEIINDDDSSSCNYNFFDINLQEKYSIKEYEDIKKCKFNILENINYLNDIQLKLSDDIKTPFKKKIEEKIEEKIGGKTNKDYYKKYIEYKIKYLNLKNNQ